MMDGNIFNTRGVHVAIVRGPAIFDLKGKKLYDLKAQGLTLRMIAKSLNRTGASADSRLRALRKAKGK